MTTNSRLETFYMILKALSAEPQTNRELYFNTSRSPEPINRCMDQLKKAGMVNMRAVEGPSGRLCEQYSITDDGRQFFSHLDKLLQ